MQAHLQDVGALLIFGSGRAPHCGNGRLVESGWRSGASRASLACGVPVVPAAIDARNSRIYYWLRSAAQVLSAGNDDFGAMVGSLRYAAELIDKLGGRFDVHYGRPIPPGGTPDALNTAAESLVPGLYD